MLCDERNRIEHNRVMEVVRTLLPCERRAESGNFESGER